MIDKKILELDLKRVYTITNKILTFRSYEKFGNHSPKTITQKFGSWSNMLQIVFGVEPKIKKLKNTNCLECNKPTKNPKFCCRSCAVTHNGKIENGRLVGRKSIDNKCYICQKWIHAGVKKCKECQTLIKTNSGKFVKAETVTKEELLTKDTQKYRRIRSHARVIALQNKLLKKCLVCDYYIHVDCAHIKAIKDFDNSCLISEINKPENLMGLCRNHHWEYDHGLLKL